MDSTESVYCATRDEWRARLSENHDKSKGIWLIFYKKGSGKPRVPYDEAVEEALCFGWIDSTARAIDEASYAQRYSPRNANSEWSELNVSRAERLIKEGRMTTAGLAKYDAQDAALKAKARALDYNTVPLGLPEALEANPAAVEYYNQITASQRKMFFRWINSAKRADTKENRIKESVELLAQRKKLTDKYNQ